MFDEKFISYHDSKAKQNHYLKQDVLNNILDNIKDLKNISKDKICIISNETINHNQDLIPKKHNIEIVTINNFLSSRQQYDIVISANNMHKINNINLYMQTIHEQLNDNCLFFGTLLNDGNCIELCASFFESYNQLKLPYVNHFIPVVKIQDASHLLSINNFSNIVVSAESITKKYTSLQEALQDIKSMNEQNCLSNRLKQGINKNALHLANEIFMNKYQGNCTYSILNLFAQKK